VQKINNSYNYITRSFNSEKTTPTYAVNPKIENNKNTAFERKTIATKYTICQNYLHLQFAEHLICLLFCILMNIHREWHCIPVYAPLFCAMRS